ncbi:PREDICTED: uncharacterized protein LOC108445899 [Corvus brachyrhynchos]|uniref:uncharacterized protein LOC108445899 n=1 Tax=Corvus brachyrhynchos TaxID=85066 RepID=UPI0008167CF1|nr:PREDICTED: uncharacterized protein LOC108445899 [Corvus brachyrhynchos]
MRSGRCSPSNLPCAAQRRDPAPPPLLPVPHGDSDIQWQRTPIHIPPPEPPCKRRARQMPVPCAGKGLDLNHGCRAGWVAHSEQGQQGHTAGTGSSSAGTGWSPGSPPQDKHSRAILLSFRKPWVSSRTLRKDSETALNQLYLQEQPGQRERHLQQGPHPAATGKALSLSHSHCHFVTEQDKLFPAHTEPLHLEFLQKDEQVKM